MSGQLARAEALMTVWMRYEAADDELRAPVARWLNFTQSPQGLDVELSACPVLASDVLSRYLWSRAFAAVVTSATLTALGKFANTLINSELTHLYTMGGQYNAGFVLSPVVILTSVLSTY